MPGLACITMSLGVVTPYAMVNMVSRPGRTGVDGDPPMSPPATPVVEDLRASVFPLCAVARNPDGSYGVGELLTMVTWKLRNEL